MTAVSDQETGSVAHRVSSNWHFRELHYDQKQYHDPVMKRSGISKSHKRTECGLSRDASSLRRTLSGNEDTSPTALPLLLTMVEGPDRLPGDEDLQEVLRGKLRIMQADSAEVNSLFMELSTHLVSVSSEENAIFVTFRTFEEIWRFTTYYTIGFLGQCMECLLFDQEFWLSSLDHNHMRIEVSIQEDTFHLMYNCFLMQEGSLFASCSSNQMFDSSTSGGDLYLEQGDIAQFEPPFLGSSWTALSLADGARGTKPKPALEPVVPFYQWFLKSCPENILVGGGKPACDFPLQFATGTCLATAEYIAEGPNELSMAPGDRIIIMGLLVSCFDWFMGRMETSGAVGLVKTCLVKPTNDICDTPEIFLNNEDRTLFSLKEEQIIEDTIALLKKMSQNDVGYIYQLDLFDQQEKRSSPSASSNHIDTEHSEFKINIERILRQGPAPSCNSTATAGPNKEDVLEDTEPSTPKFPCFTVHPVIDGACSTESMIPLITFLDSCDYKSEFGLLYEQTAEGLASSAFSGHMDEDELTSFLAVARETSRRKRLYWSQSRLCYMLGKLCGGRSKFSQARVYFEEALSVPQEGFRDTMLVASIYANLASIYLKQKNTEKYFAMSERIAALVTAVPECIASADNDSEILKCMLKKAVLSGNAKAEARSCFLLARAHLGRDEAATAAPYIERLLVLCAENLGMPNVSPSHCYLSLGRFYGAFSRPHLSVAAARRASQDPSVTLGDCLGGLALVLENSSGLLGARARESHVPTAAAVFLRQALALLERSAVARDDGEVDDSRGRYHALSRALTLALSQLFLKHGRTGWAVHVMSALVDRGRLPPGLSVAERNGTLLWLAWLHVGDRQPHLAVDVLDAILASMPEHCTTTQEGLVLNMRGVALRQMGDLRRAAESYQAAIDVCEEFEDRPNWAIALANLGLLCLKAGAKRLAERHLTAAVELFSALEGEGHEARFACMLLELGDHHVTQGQLEHGRGCLEWALLLAIKADLADCQLSATRRLCHLYGTVSPDRARCIMYNEHQLNLLRSNGDAAQEACVLETVGQLYLSLGTKRANRTALDYTKRSLGIFIDLGHKEKEAYGWLQAGKIYHMLGQIELVDLYVQVAQDVGLNTGDTNFILGLLEAAGDVFFNSAQDRDKAVCFYRDRALPIAVKTGNVKIKLRLCNKLVELMLSLKLYGEAVEFAHTALDISISTGERLNERVACHRLATLYHSLGQLELAEHHYLKALALCPTMLQFDEETMYYVRVYQTLGDITFYDLKDPHDAAGYYHLALAAAMDLGNKKSQLQLCTRLATIYHNFLVDRELSLFFYQKARGFAAALNVRRVNISPEQQSSRPLP